MTGPIEREIRHAHLYCGLGGGAKGFNRGEARVGNLVGRYRCLGGIDVDPAAIRDFERNAGVPGTVLDLFDIDQFMAFHGRPPERGWRPAGTTDIHSAFQNERPHILFLSAPCKGFSGLLSETASRTAKYQALNALTLRGIWLALEAYKDDPVELILFENVPRIATRGRHLLDQIVALLRHYGYAVAETTHDCGEIGGLAQSRKRFLLVARHAEKIPNFLYEPVKHRLRGVGEVLERLPLPLSGLGGPMHRMPSLQWKTWVRLAFVEAGADWRSLNRLRVQDGMLADFGIEPDVDWHAGVYGVQAWTDPSATVTSRSGPSNGCYAVADPRVDGHPKSVQLGVSPWEQPAPTVTTKMIAGGGRHAVADPRTGYGEATRKNVFRIVRWDEPAGSITAGHGPSSGGMAVADPRTTRRNGAIGVLPWSSAAGTVAGESLPPNGRFAVADPRPADRQDYKQTKYRVTSFDEAAGTVIAASTTGNGAFSVADPRPGALARDGRAGYLTQGHYGVVPWSDPAAAVTAWGQHDNGRWSVADPRLAAPAEPAFVLPAQTDRLVCVIRALDGTWHRPFTTLELAALQSLLDVDDERDLAAFMGATLDATQVGDCWFVLDGNSDSAWRERIGNAVPPRAAKAIANVMGRTLLLAWSGETFALSSEPIWVRPAIAALMVAEGEPA